MPRTRELPPPLPPEERTVGQLVGEAIRLYGTVFVRALPLGLAVAAINQVTVGLGRIESTGVLILAAPVFTLAYAYAVWLALATRVPARSWVVAFGVGIVTWIPAALLFPWFALAAVLWLALVGLGLPAAMAEGTSLTASLRRGVRLGRVDYVHAAGSLATIVILFALTRVVLSLLLESQAENTVRTAIFLADAVLAPILFLGAALLYVDQEARLRSRDEPRKERDAHVPDAVHAHRKRRANAARKSRPSS